ncbi:MAG: proteinase inhibitor [Deltaproteobacteria bacterium]|nr:proteinase inhibitor [Deltaproteobacteria bacterium]
MAVGRCEYINLFSGAAECREYTGEEWGEEAARADCDAQGASGEPATFGAEGCARAAHLATCHIDEGAPRAYDIVFSGADPDAECQTLAQGCVVFAGGRFEPAAACVGRYEEVTPPPPTGDVFQPFERVCAAPADGAPGLSEGGQVCAWQGISGCVEPGRRFADYARCEPVLTQRPYYAARASGFETPADDPVRQDPAFLAEVEWARGEAEACGCVCCHDQRLAPAGAAVWDTARAGIWTDDFTLSGLAMGAGWVNTEVLGAFPAEENNGFERAATALPTTDRARMVRFFEGELARRGARREDFADATPIGGPLYEQAVFSPAPCARGEGVSAAGDITWAGGGARYLHVLRADAPSPGVPPNRDQPAGTLFRFDVDPAAAPVTRARYGEAPEGARRVWPEGAPEALVAGERYYLYVQRDVGIPLTRCLFTYGAGAPPAPPASPWGDACAAAADCPAPTDHCVKSPGQATGYCSVRCLGGGAACAAAGAPAAWQCNAISCEVEALTWCGPAEEVAASGGFLKVCP